MLPLSIFFASSKNSLGNPTYYFFPHFNVRLVAMKYCMTVIASQNAWGDAGGFNSILLFLFSCGLAVHHYLTQPCLGGPTAANINHLRQTSFTVAAWIALMRVFAVMSCNYGDCDALWSIWPILGVCGAPFIAYAAVRQNMIKTEEILGKDSHMQILFGDAIKGNFAETLGKNALVLTDFSTDRTHAIQLVEHLKKSRRNAQMGLQLELDLFKNTKPKDIYAMLVVADPHVLYLGCEMMYRIYAPGMGMFGAEGIPVEHPDRKELMELGATLCNHYVITRCSTAALSTM